MAISPRAIPEDTALASLFHRVPFRSPVGSEIGSDVQRLYVCEAERVQLPVSGADIGAFAPGAAAAIDDDGLGVIEALHPIAEGLKPRLRPSRTGIFRSRDVRLRKEDV